MNKKLIMISILFSFIFLSCKFNDENITYNETLATKEIKNRAFEFAKLYKESDTEYKLGGQDPVRAAIKIDCSGLVIMCYKYALVDTKYKLVLPDMSVSYIYENAVKITKNPERGDLIFMGESNSDKISHIAIYDSEIDENIYFIDSTENDSVSGVSRRNYEKNNPKFKAFGVMKLKF